MIKTYGGHYERYLYFRSSKDIGADDTTLDLFESQYQIPNGVSYNSYVILDEKVAVWIPLMSGKQTSGLQILRMC